MAVADAFVNSVTLAHGEYEAQVLPALGGGLARLRWRGHDLVQCLPKESATDPKPGQLGMFPMVPWGGRIENAEFTWHGATYQVTPFPPEPHALHGDGWKSVWEVAHGDTSRVLLKLEVRNTPLAHRAELEYKLDSAGLSVRLEIASLADRPMPFGLGQHPWFPRKGAETVQFVADRFWMHDPAGIPTDAISLAQELDFSEGGPIPAGFRNNCYEGWDGHFRITYPARQLAVRMTASSALDWLMVYCNPDLDAVCFEPQSHLPAAHNMPGSGERLGLVELAPGESLSGSITLAADPL